MIAADVAFRATANTAAAAYQQAPPYLAYRTDVTVDIPSLRQHKVISRTVETRTQDDFAVLQDLPQGQRQYAHSFPLIPTFDALSYFHLTFNGSRRDTLSYVELEKVLTFSDSSMGSHSDVVVTYLRYYHAEYAPDTNDRIAHIVMVPLPTLTRDNNSDFFLHDVYVDNATNLPTRVVYAGPTTDFTVDYATVSNHWLVQHVIFARTLYGPLKIGRVHFTVDATNSDFSFPTTPSDPRLAGPPATPSPSPPR
jgi:hypothetical protein